MRNSFGNELSYLVIVDIDLACVLPFQILPFIYTYKLLHIIRCAMCYGNGLYQATRRALSSGRNGGAASALTPRKREYRVMSTMPRQRSPRYHCAQQELRTTGSERYGLAGGAPNHRRAWSPRIDASSPLSSNPTWHLQLLRCCSENTR